MEDKIKKALLELRKEKKRKFNQTVELIINLRKIDVKKTQLNFFVSVPFKVKEKKICAFLEVKNENVDTITPDEFKRYSNKKDIKKLSKKYDFFIAESSLMPKVAATFGKVLGPAGKMPSPQLGIISNTGKKDIEDVIKKVNSNIRIKLKEPSIKVAIGKESNKDEEILENIMSVYNSVIKNLPKGKENVKNILIKFSMSKPQKVNIR
ncbi:MAG: hypothetical protein QXU40_02385 [Candidatus Pacearchaeota archaeon]